MSNHDEETGAEMAPAHAFPRGRELYLRFAALACTFTVFNIVDVYRAIGPERLPVQLVRLTLTVGMLAGIYRGVRWLRYLGAALFALGGLGMLMIGLVMKTGWGRVTPLSYAFVYVMFVRHLLASGDVRAFLEAQSRRLG